MTLPRHAPLVVTTRGGSVECVHYGSVAVVDRAGRMVASAGDPRALNFTRSSLKPFQALAFVEDGGLARFGFGARELALMCASHNAEPLHLAIVRRMLARIGARERDLQCGSHPPMVYAATGRTPPARRWSQLCHNCSGKHAGFLGWCRLHRRPLAEYLEPASPLQRRIRATLMRLAPRAPLARGIDNCGAPNYALPLARLAQLYCRLATDDTAGLAALRGAMTRYPDLVSGTGRMDLALMRAGSAQRPGDWVAKAGAAGMQAIGVRSAGLGIAVRIADGSPEALRAATLEVLRQLGLLAGPVRGPLVRFAPGIVRDNRGREVGRVLAKFRLRRG